MTAIIDPLTGLTPAEAEARLKARRDANLRAVLAPTTISTAKVGTAPSQTLLITYFDSWQDIRAYAWRPLDVRDFEHLNLEVKGPYHPSANYRTPEYQSVGDATQAATCRSSVIQSLVHEGRYLSLMELNGSTSRIPLS